MNSNDKSFEYNGTRYFVEEQDQFYFFYTWYENEKVLSEPIIKDRVKCLNDLYNSLNKGVGEALASYFKSLIERAMYDIEKKINQMKVNRMLYEAEMKRKSWEQSEHDKIWKKAVNK